VAMATLSYWMNVSLDLFIEGKAGEQGGGDWMRIGEPLHREFNARARDLDAMVQGRVVFEIMEGFWPAAREDASLPDYMREYGHIWTDKPKILVSSTRTSAPYDTRVASSIDEVAAMCAGIEGRVGVGGAAVATHLLERGLLDELMLFVHPVVLGTGRPLFDRISSPVQCDLVEHAAFEGGVTLQRYAVRKG
jgi:dihydrofolate reductase